jgi:hypothetical protein
MLVKAMMKESPSVMISYLWGWPGWEWVIRGGSTCVGGWGWVLVGGGKGGGTGAEQTGPGAWGVGVGVSDPDYNGWRAAQ